MIAEREAEIREIETGIHELNDIFRDLGTIVEQQGGLVGTHSTQLPPRCSTVKRISDSSSR